MCARHPRSLNVLHAADIRVGNSGTKYSSGHEHGVRDSEDVRGGERENILHSSFGAPFLGRATNLEVVFLSICREFNLCVLAALCCALHFAVTGTLVTPVLAFLREDVGARLPDLILSKDEVRASAVHIDCLVQH